MFGELIPDRFQIYGRTIEVEWEDDLIQHGNSRCNGLCDYDRGVIKLSNKVPESSKDHVFFHELVHMLLAGMNHELYENEEFVEVFSGLLHQALSTAERDGDVIDVGRINLMGYSGTSATGGYTSWTGTNGDGKAVIDNGAVG